MRKLRKIRSTELISIILIAILFTGWRLFTENMHYESMLTIDQNARYESLTSYNFWLNTIFPVIARTVLIFIAWYIFHYLLYPKINEGYFKDTDLWYMVIVMVCTATGIFLYYYFKIYISTIINFNVITDIRTYSLYRKQTVVADTIGILIIFSTYEFLMRFFYYLYERLACEKEFIFRIVGFLILANVVACLIIFAIVVPLTAPLWQGWTARLLLMGGLLIQVYIFQAYVYRKLISFFAEQNLSKIAEQLFIYLVLVSAGTLILWKCYSQFEGSFIKPVAFISVLSLLSSGIIAYIRNSLLKEKAILQTQVSSSAAELLSLRSQINPHFLFNALNSLYSTALKEKSDKTADGIQKLGDMMRFMLEENNQERIPLDKEIEYLHNYIDLQRMRVDESQGIEIRVNIQQPEKEIFIAPMLLNPFVENAFKHGISLQHPSWIYITLTLDTTSLYFKVHNSLHTRKDNDPEQENSGVGLSNVKKRLALIYPNRHTLDIQQSDKDFFVSLTLSIESQ